MGGRERERGRGRERELLWFGARFPQDWWLFLSAKVSVSSSFYVCLFQVSWGQTDSYAHGCF